MRGTNPFVAATQGVSVDQDDARIPRMCRCRPTQIAELELRAGQIEQVLLYDDWPALSAGTRSAPAEDAVRANIVALLQRSMSRRARHALCPRPC